MGHQSEYLTIAIFDDESKIQTFVDLLVQRYKFMLLEKVRHKNARPYNIELINGKSDYSEEFMKKYRNKAYDFNINSGLGYIHKNIADSDLFQYRFDVDFDEYFRYLLDENETIENVKGKINRSFDTQFNIFFYYDTNLRKYILFQNIWDNIYYWLNDDYFFYFYDAKNYILYREEFNSNFGLVSDKYEKPSKQYYNFYKKLIIKLFQPNVFIDLPIYLNSCFFDEDIILNLNYYLLGNKGIEFKKDFHWDQVKLYD